MAKKLKKAYEITDAKIAFVSLVDKAANQKQFLITKAAGGKADFSTYGRIVKADVENHYLTGIVYEPLVEDSHGNFMTEEEIVKAAYWFAKNGDKVDVQHSFEELSEATIVENWVAKSDMTIEEEAISKGTWLMTVEVTDPDVWDAVQKKEITGFSMGGVGVYSEEDTDLSNVEKSKESKNDEKKGIFKQLATALGFDVVEKGAMTEKYLERVKSNNFWSAFSTLEDILRRYNWASDKYDFEDDEDKIREVLSEFNEIVVELLTQKSITKALATAASESPEEANITKAGRSMSTKNRDALSGICESLTTFLKEFEDPEEDDPEKKDDKKKSTTDESGDDEEKEVKKEDDNMKATEVQEMIDQSVTKAMEPISKALEVLVKDEGNGSSAEPAAQAATDVTPETIADMVAKSTATAMEPVTKALEAVLKSRGVPSNLNDEPAPIEKGEQHYMHGIL